MASTHDEQDDYNHHHNHDITHSATTYAEGRTGEPFVYVGSMGYLEVGVREARADRLLGARPGMKVELI